MKANINTVLEGPNVVLVPYGRHHVPKYHEWMQNAELRELTASEPLSIDEEYDMQQNWQVDEDKLTFIILARQPHLPNSGTGAGCMDVAGAREGRGFGALTPQDPRLETMTMIGDVNLFLKGSRGSRDQHGIEGLNGEVQDTDDEDDFEAEVEIMIAEPDYRRKGLAIETLRLMLGYATGSPTGSFPPPPLDSAHPPDQNAPSNSPLYSSPLPVSPTSIITRISESNTASIKLFEKLGFAVTKRVPVFAEIEMRFRR